MWGWEEVEEVLEFSRKKKKERNLMRELAKGQPSASASLRLEVTILAFQSGQGMLEGMSRMGDIGNFAGFHSLPLASAPRLLTGASQRF